MVRTIISLPEGDKRWLDRYSHSHGQSFAEAIRQAVRLLRRDSNDELRKKHLKETFGILKDRKEDAVEFVRKLRDEWD